MTPTHGKLKPRVPGRGKRPSVKHSKAIGIDYGSIGSIDHVCNGCSGVSKCCCAKYEVSVTAVERNKIIKVLPEAA